MNANDLPFDPLLTYDTAEVDLGQAYWSQKLKAWVALVKNLSATTITAGMICSATTTDRNTGGARPMAVAAALNFAGVRPTGAADMPQNTYGAIIVKGPALSVIHTGQAVDAAEMPVVSEGTAGACKKYLGVTTDATSAVASTLAALGVFAVSQAASSAGFVDLNIKNSVYSC